MAPYPSQQEIRAIFESIGPGGGNFMDHVDPNVKLEVMGHEHLTRKAHVSHQALAEEFFGQFEFVDWDNVELKAHQVIGGGDSSWASVECTSVGKSKKGKPLNHECVFITNFNSSGKIVEIRAYFDTAHIDEHFKHHKNN